MSSVVSLIRRPTLRLNPADDVVIAARPLVAGTVIESEGVTCINAIPAGHKVAVRAIEKGQPVHRYNQIIGFATKDIAPGEHVHTQNLEFETFERDYAIGVDV
jgi:altronate hydrolase